MKNAYGKWLAAVAPRVIIWSAVLWMVLFSTFASATFNAPFLYGGYNSNGNGVFNPPLYTSQQTACDTGLASQAQYGITSVTPDNTGFIGCRFFGGACGSGGCQSSLQSGYVCPPNSTGGSTCTCTGTYIEDGQTCNPLCMAGREKALLTSMSFDARANGGLVCAGGCIQTTGIAPHPIGVCSSKDPGMYACSYWGRQTGASCSSPTNFGEPETAGSAAPISCQYPKCAGKVNGVDVCLACGAPTTEFKKYGADTTINPDGSTSSTTTETTTGKGGGPATTTTTITNTPAGGGAGAVTQTTSAVPFDAKENEQEKFCLENPDVVGCKTLGTPVAGDELGSQARGPSSITPVSIGGSGNCPASIPLPVGEWSFSGMCQVADGVRPVVLAIAWLIAATILIGAFRNE